MKRTESTNNRLNEIHEHNIDVDSNTVYLHGYIGNDSDDDPGTDFRMANKFMKNLHTLAGKCDQITIHQHNIGGSWDAGIMIYDCISNCKTYVEMICHGSIMSMGTIVLQAADCRVSMPNCDFMFHYGYSGEGSLNHLELQSYAEYDKKLRNKILEIYLSRCKNSEAFKDKNNNQIKTFLRNKLTSKGDWYLSAEEAKYYGFIDKIVGVDSGY